MADQRCVDCGLVQQGWQQVVGELAHAGCAVGAVWGRGVMWCADGSGTTSVGGGGGNVPGNGVAAGMLPCGHSATSWQ